MRLRTDLKTAQAAIPAAPPKKTVVDDTEPAKEAGGKKKPVAKKPATAPALRRRKLRQRNLNRSSCIRLERQAGLSFGILTSCQLMSFT